MFWLLISVGIIYVTDKIIPIEKLIPQNIQDIIFNIFRIDLRDDLLDSAFTDNTILDASTSALDCTDIATSQLINQHNTEPRLLNLIQTIESEPMSPLLEDYEIL